MDEVKAYLKRIGARGGKASAAKLTAAQRKAKARKAGLARAAKAKKEARHGQS